MNEWGADFKKEQLRVYTRDKGMLVIEGERPVDATKWSRFCKEITLGKDCNPREIRAKFSNGNGVLSVVMPKTKNVKAENEGAKSGAEKGGVWGVKISKRRAVKVAVVVVAVLIVVAVGSQIPRLLHFHPRPPPIPHSF